MQPQQLPPQDQQGMYADEYAQPAMPMMGGAMESGISNIVGQIDPQTIIDNFDHALKGEQWNKEQGKWETNDSKEPLVNDACRGAIINYLTPALTNNTTMGHIDEKRQSLFMEGVIETIRKEFATNLEKFGFVPPGEEFDEGVYYNRGTPDSAKMTMVSYMVYQVCFLVLSRAVKGVESYRIFKSLTMSDAMGYDGQGANQKKDGWASKIFGSRS